MAKTDNVVELMVGDPTVESIVARLNRYQDDIENIVCLVEWKAEGEGEMTTIQPCWSQMKNKDLAWMILYLELYLKKNAIGL